VVAVDRIGMTELAASGPAMRDSERHEIALLPTSGASLDPVVSEADREFGGKAVRPG
jgi:hypothetical protein